MAEVPITGLPSVVGNPTETDLYVLVRGGVTSKQTLGQLRGALGIRTVASRYIEGLELEWSTSSVIVKPGAAFISASGIALESLTPITLPLTGLTTGVLYHVYYYAGPANAPSAEITSAAPVAAPTGGYTKTGDASRRYLGTVLAASGTTVHRFHQNGNRMYYNTVNMGAAPFVVLPSGAATITTDVSVSAVAPTTTVSVIANVVNADPTTPARISNSDIGTISPTNCRQTIRGASGVEFDILLSSAKTFSYAYDATPTSVLQVRVNSYTFKR